MSATVRLAELHFPQLEGWTRVLGAPSLETLEQKAEEARQRGVPYEALGYGLETSATTPEGEWQDLLASTEEARALADKYGKMLLMGPGFRLMSENEQLYPEMANLADIWVVQTQRLQRYPPGPVYAQAVQEVISQIKAGNPDIPIWAQIAFFPDREPKAEEWLAYHESIVDITEGRTYIGAYIWDTADPEKLTAAIDAIFDEVCGND
jgi:hypothetical protein